MYSVQFNYWVLTFSISVCFALVSKLVSLTKMTSEHVISVPPSACWGLVCFVLILKGNSSFSLWLRCKTGRGPQQSNRSTILPPHLGSKPVRPSQCRWNCVCNGDWCVCLCFCHQSFQFGPISSFKAKDRYRKSLVRVFKWNRRRNRRFSVDLHDFFS